MIISINPHCCSCCETQGPVAEFSYSQSGEDPCCFSFTDESTAGACGTIDEWHWDFGDGETSDEQNPIHCYLGPGPFFPVVTLTVTDSAGCSDSTDEEIEVTEECCRCDAPGGEPTANFSVSQVSPIPCCFQFTDESTNGGCGTINSWHWEFGDGDTSTEQNPEHCYPSIGPWNPVLTVTDTKGCEDSATMEVECEYDLCCDEVPPCPGSITVELSNWRGNCTFFNRGYTVDLRPDLSGENTCVYRGEVIVPTGPDPDDFLIATVHVAVGLIGLGCIEVGWSAGAEDDPFPGYALHYLGPEPWCSLEGEAFNLVSSSAYQSACAYSFGEFSEQVICIVHF